ncbi:MAG: hypothetical protein ACI9FW_000947 [Flavobacterium sp.]|jgi:hypothetical protein
MRKIFLFILLSVLFVSCKTTQLASNVTALKGVKVEEIVKGHNDNFKDFSTLSIRTDVKYQDIKNRQSISADIRIKKDEIIWINIKFLGFPVAKALITPTKVSYYEKIKGTYFEGDFILLSNWLGTDLDFKKVQNLLLGKALDEISKEVFVSQIVENMYQLSEKKPKNIQKQYTFEAGQFLLKKEFIKQLAQEKSLEINYISHSIEEGTIFPKEMNIKASQKNEVSIDVEYTKVEINAELTFPFSIPNNYEQVEIKQQ